MSLATRCTTCQTAFRVVQDQLKVSEGWVRCGRCGAVFNALEELFDLGSEEGRRTAEALAAATPVSGPMPLNAIGEPAGSRAGADPATGRTARDAPADIDRSLDTGSGFGDATDPTIADALDPPLPPAAGSAEAAAIDDLLADPIDAHLFRKRRVEEKKPAAQVSARDRHEFSDARFDSDLFADPAETEDDLTVLEAHSTGAGDLPLESQTGQPDFLRRAEQRARWKSRPMAALLAVLGIAGTLLLAVQAGHHFRDPIAAAWPAGRPMLAAWCSLAGCAIEAPRQVDAIAVESTALSRAIGRDGYNLAVTLQSRSPHAVATPWIDLALTDANGRLIAKRALAPRDFGVPAVVAARGELAMQLTLDAGAARVAGYTVEIFYP